MRTPSLADRLQAATAAKKALLERARAISEDPERNQRQQARAEIIAARNARIAERDAVRQAAKEREAAELAAAHAAEAAAREAERQVRDEAEAAQEAARRVQEAEEAAKLEAILAARRAGRKKKKRHGH